MTRFNFLLGLTVQLLVSTLLAYVSQSRLTLDPVIKVRFRGSSTRHEASLVFGMREVCHTLMDWNAPLVTASKPAVDTKINESRVNPMCRKTESTAMYSSSKKESITIVIVSDKSL